MHMPPGPAGTWSYTIRPGDSLRLIAQRFHTTTQAILSSNPALSENNLRTGQTIYIPRGYSSLQASAQPMPEGVSQAEEALSNRMRLLWEQHVYWTRLVILSMAFGLPDAQLATARLLRNPRILKRR